MSKNGHDNGGPIQSPDIETALNTTSDESVDFGVGGSGMKRSLGAAKGGNAPTYRMQCTDSINCDEWLEESKTGSSSSPSDDNGEDKKSDGGLNEESVSDEDVENAGREQGAVEEGVGMDAAVICRNCR